MRRRFVLGVAVVALTLPLIAVAAPSAAALDRGKLSPAMAWFVDRGGYGAYPIASATFLIVYEDMCKAGKSQDTAQRVSNWLNYALGGGQQVASTLQYAPLPSNIKTKAQAKVDALKCNGSALQKPQT